MFSGHNLLHTQKNDTHVPLYQEGSQKGAGGKEARKKENQTEK